VGLFSKKKEPATSGGSAAPPRFGAGRRLECAQAPPEAIGTIAKVLDSFAPTNYRHMPPLSPAAIDWFGEEPAPVEAWGCSYGTDDFFVFTLWPRGGGSVVGLFPLGGSEESLNTPFIGQWKQADSSLTSTGRFEPRQFALRPPELPATYFEDILRIAGKPVNAANVAAVAEQIGQMFLVKAHQFMSNQDARAADRFLDDHRWSGDLTLPQQILRDLGNWNHQVIPYIQDLPYRAQGILLEPGPDGTMSADIWQRMK